ncbi:succinylglutamate desuccinylase/aspartoacylase family protein [Candidatus Woesearchaeota archaeon]|nr:succinylglutamate desuccinylase/aspartoacylase family protein [Candidatus Woesearchaeota archaeon]
MLFISEIIRSYRRDVISKLERLPHLCNTIGRLTNESGAYPLFRVVAAQGGRHNGRKDVLISGGVHGDEPSGVYAVMDFLEHHVWEYLDRFRFFAYPCINPWGFERHLRDNAQGVNINRTFGDTLTSEEGEAVKSSIKQANRRYAITDDMHESGTEEGNVYEYVAVISGFSDGRNHVPSATHFKERDTDMPLTAVNKLFKPKNKGEVYSTEIFHDYKTRRCVEWSLVSSAMKASVYMIPYEFYLYEYLADDEKRLGASIISALESDTPICRWSRIAGDRSTDGVVRWPDGGTNPEYAQMSSLDAFLYRNYADVALTTETPKHWSIERRVETHIRALKAALDACLVRDKMEPMQQTPSSPC